MTLFFLKVARMSLSENCPWAMPTILISSPSPCAIGSEGQLFDIVVLIEAGALERLLELLELRRQDAGLQIHGGRRVLHRAVIDDDDLLHIVRNGGARVAVELRSQGHGGQRRAGRG